MNEIKLTQEPERGTCNGSAGKLVKLSADITQMLISLKDDEESQQLSQQLVSCGLINVIIGILNNENITVTLDDKRIICEMIAELAKFGKFILFFSLDLNFFLNFTLSMSLNTWAHISIDSF